MSDLLYLYSLIPTNESNTPLPSLQGFDDKSELYMVSIGDDVTAIVCDVATSEETIKEKIDQDVEWLQEKAFHHHERVLQLSKLYTLIPLKFCTLYKSEASLRDTVESNYEKLKETFSLIEGKEEWNVKIYCDDEALRKQVSENNTAIQAKREEIEELSPGKKFFERKKMDHYIDQELENEKTSFCEGIHDALNAYSVLGNIKKNWKKDVTGRKENMAWNSVFLLPQHEVEAFITKFKEYEEKFTDSGWQFEASGPWPAYHFSSFTS
ncbi:GvpL/GvpF family gas vesicle protein [Guptibacillus algicola]|uniref:GvpL/GvpF family gas vesicle protein n=1 Tax=Guptibacillus algicola TaxID=225844 RepID=UPI001CD25739|nr:GvpL/GvpF family gas vesicle protein [Alkalihalobacillus algicola]MCA0987087.1 GvpL/GvpF family gas vesicle protein [Alkalihalobacillus algicola]